MAGSALSPFSGFGPGLGEYRVVIMSRMTGWASFTAYTNAAWDWDYRLEGGRWRELRADSIRREKPRSRLGITTEFKL